MAFSILHPRGYDVHSVANYGQSAVTESRTSFRKQRPDLTSCTPKSPNSGQAAISWGCILGLMARTRAQEHPDAPKPEYAPSQSKPQGHAAARGGDQKKPVAKKDKKRKVEDVDKASVKKAKNEQAPASKKSKTADSTSPQHTKPKPSAVDTSKLDALLSSYGAHPLQDTSLPKQNEPTPETVLALLYLSMLSSARISHELAYKSLQCLIEAGYHDIETLKKSTWQERTGVLTKGGYTRYREKTATALGELADFIEKEYGVLYLDAGSPSRSLQLTSHDYRQRSQQSSQESRFVPYQSPEIARGNQRHW